MANKQQFRGPKRRIETISCQISHLSNIAVTNSVLHTAEDTKTLVRTILQLDAVHLHAALEVLTIKVEH